VIKISKEILHFEPDDRLTRLTSAIISLCGFVHTDYRWQAVPALSIIGVIGALAVVTQF
jgi:hypothetical protein